MSKISIEQFEAVVQELGFKSAAEFHRLVANVDLEKCPRLFSMWKTEGGTKEQLLALPTLKKDQATNHTDGWMKRLMDVECDECGEKGMGVTLRGAGHDRVDICCDCCSAIAEAEADADNMQYEDDEDDETDEEPEDEPPVQITPQNADPKKLEPMFKAMDRASAKAKKNRKKKKKIKLIKRKV